MRPTAAPERAATSPEPSDGGAQEDAAPVFVYKHPPVAGATVRPAGLELRADIAVDRRGRVANRMGRCDTESCTSQGPLHCAREQTYARRPRSRTPPRSQETERALRRSPRRPASGRLHARTRGSGRRAGPPCRIRPWAALCRRGRPETRRRRSRNPRAWGRAARPLDAPAADVGGALLLSGAVSVPVHPASNARSTHRVARRWRSDGAFLCRGSLLIGRIGAGIRQAYVHVRVWATGWTSGRVWASGRQA